MGPNPNPDPNPNPNPNPNPGTLTIRWGPSRPLSLACPSLSHAPLATLSLSRSCLSQVDKLKQEIALLKARTPRHDPLASAPLPHI